MRPNDARSLVGALLVLAALSSPAAAALVRPIRFEQLSLEEGLSQAAVMDVLQDRRGYIWLATEDGLNRYDGTGFKVYRHDTTNPDTLPDNFIWDVEQDGNGSVWVATRGGLCRWDRATDRIVRQDTPGVRHIRVLRYQARGNNLWIGTRESGLLQLDLATGALRRFAHDAADPNSLVDDRVYALHVDGKDRLWVGTDGGLDLRNANGNGFTHQLPSGSDSSSPGDVRVRAILADDVGALWVGTSGGGLNRLDLASGRFERFRHDPAVATSLAHDDVRALLQDSGGRLWVGTSGGLDLYDPGRGAFAHYRQEPRNPGSLSDDHVLSLAQDRGGVLWVGTRMGGVHKWNPLSWQFGHVAPDPDNPRGLGGGRVTALAEDRAGDLWIGTYGAGLYAMDRSSGDMKAYRHDDRSPRSLPSDQVMALRHDHRDDLWIGTLDSGLVRMTRATGVFKSYPYDPKKPEGLSARGVTSILEDGDLWVGTYGGGLERFDPQTERFTHFRHDPRDDSSLSGDRVAAMAKVGDGRLWVGTMETGLNLLDPRTGRFERFNHRAGDTSSLPSDAVHALHVDVAGSLWVGTHSGLSQLQPDGKSFKTYSTRNGLPSDVIYAIANDQHGRLWLSTNNGLSAFDPRSGQFVNYGVSNGLQAREFNFGAWYQSATGELFFGGLNGFNAFVPDRIRQLAHAPEVVLTAVTVDHRPLGGPADETQSIRLGFRDKVLGLEFAALDFTAPGRNLFSYKLDGFDPEWVPLSGKRSVTYTNLNPGRYAFHLRGANSDGRWNENGLSVPVNVAAPPWATPSAYGVYALFLIGAVLGVTSSQKRKFARETEYRRRLEREVETRVREIEALTDLREKEHLREFLKPLGEGALPVPSDDAMTVDLGTLAESSATPEGPPAVFSDRFDNLETVGRGGMGVVYRARDRELDETVAIKLLRREFLGRDDVVLERFKREIKLARRVTHPNVLRLYEFGEHDGTPYISMEYVEGVTLKQVLASLGAFPLVAGMCIARQACSGLGAAHAHGIVHRDVKPQNMLVLPATGVLKIADFGISRACAVSWELEALTAQGIVVGTPEYIAPEQALGRATSPRTDVYALGVVLFEVFTGTLPFVGDSPMATIVLHMSSVPPRPSSLNLGIPTGLEETILKCLEKDPAKRFEDANELLRALATTVTPLELTAVAAAGAARPATLPGPM